MIAEENDQSAKHKSEKKYSPSSQNNKQAFKKIILNSRYVYVRYVCMIMQNSKKKKNATKKHCNQIKKFYTNNVILGINAKRYGRLYCMCTFTFWFLSNKRYVYNIKVRRSKKKYIKARIKASITQ